MNCEMAKSFMMEYFDGSKNDIEEVRFRQHLKSCGKCSEEFSSMADIFRILETEETPEPSIDFEKAVMEKVNAIENAKLEKIPRMLGLIYKSAAAVSIILLMVIALNTRQDIVLSAFESIKGYYGPITGTVSAVLGIIGVVSGVVGKLIAISLVKLLLFYISQQEEIILSVVLLLGAFTIYMNSVGFGIIMDGRAKK